MDSYDQTLDKDVFSSGYVIEYFYANEIAEETGGGGETAGWHRGGGEEERIKRRIQNL